MEHDDTLLATDALSALCSQLVIGQIDVANAEGTLIASSDATRIGLNLGAEVGFDWVMGAVEDPTAELLKTAENDRSILYCCLPRADIEGFVLLTSDDTAVDDALALSSVDALIADLPYGGDLLFQAAPGGADGFFTDSGALCLRKTTDDVTLIAARQNSVVYNARNVALIAVAALLLCVMICVVSAYLLHIELITVVCKRRNRYGAGRRRGERRNATGRNRCPKKSCLQRRVQGVRSAANARRRFSEELLEQQGQPEEETLEEHDRAVENAPRQIGRRRQRPEKQRYGSTGKTTKTRSIKS